MTAEKIEQIKEMHENGKSIATISKELVISRSSVYYLLRSKNKIKIGRFWFEIYGK